MDSSLNAIRLEVFSEKFLKRKKKEKGKKKEAKLMIVVLNADGTD